MIQLINGGNLMANSNSTFSSILSNLIEERNVSQKWVSDMTGITEATISRYANGVQQPFGIEYLVELAKAFNVSVDYLVGLTPVPEKQELTNEEKLLINCFRRASSDDKEIIKISLRKYLTTAEKLYSDSSIQKKQTKIG